MLRWLFLAALALSGTLMVVAWRNVRARNLARQRLSLPEETFLTPITQTSAPQPFVRSRPWIAPLLGLMLAAGLYLFLGWSVVFAGAAGLMVTLLGAQAETWRVDRKIQRIEAQLADAIDLMISALTAGVSVMQALETAARETQAPLRNQLEILLGRIRYGDNPQSVLRTLEQHVPLQTFRLFASALSVHWEVGGSLSGPLAIVGRTVRDRIEISRRVRSLTMQARAATVAVLLTTYFIGLVLWRNDPERMTRFLSTTLGQWMIAAAVVLQAVGIVWTARISKLEY
jgi:tight adherence protein B